MAGGSGRGAGGSRGATRIGRCGAGWEDGSSQAGDEGAGNGGGASGALGACVDCIASTAGGDGEVRDARADVLGVVSRRVIGVPSVPLVR